jgi:glutathione S-transferase
MEDDQRASKEFKQKNPFDRYPLLECQDGVLSDALAIAGYVTRGSALEAKDRVAML